MDQSNSTNTSVATQEHQNNSNGLSRRETQELQMMMSQVVNDSPKLNPKQIDKILAQRDKILDYQHQDNQRMFTIQEKNPTHSKHILLGLGIFIILIILLVGFFDRTYIGDIIKVLLGFFGGSGAGYAYAKQDKSDKTD